MAPYALASHSATLSSYASGSEHDSSTCPLAVALLCGLVVRKSIR